MGEIQLRPYYSSGPPLSYDLLVLMDANIRDHLESQSRPQYRSSETRDETRVIGEIDGGPRIWATFSGYSTLDAEASLRGLKDSYPEVDFSLVRVTTTETKESEE